MGRQLWNEKNKLQKVYRLRKVTPPNEYRPEGYESIVGPYASEGAARGQAKQRNKHTFDYDPQYVVQESETVWKDV